MAGLTDEQKRIVREWGEKVSPPQLHLMFLKHGHYVRAEAIRRYLKREGIAPACGRREPLRGVDVAAKVHELGGVRAVAEHFQCSQWAVRLALKRQRTKP